MGLSQGCHYLFDVKFKDVSMPFQDLFKEIRDLPFQLKTWTLYTLFFFSKQTLLFGFTEFVDPDNEKQPMSGHFEQ